MRYLLAVLLSLIASEALAERALFTPSANFNRPGNTTAYVSGQLVANNTAAASVTPMSFTLVGSAGTAVYVRRAVMKKSGTGVTNPNFRLHLYASQPTVTNGDGATFSSISSGYFCDLDVNMYTTTPFSDGNFGIGTPNQGAECGVVPAGSTIYGLIEARGAYAPANSETFTVTLEVYLP